MTNAQTLFHWAFVIGAWSFVGHSDLVIGHSLPRLRPPARLPEYRPRARRRGGPPMPHLLGIDIGTSGTKTLVCDEDGKVLATAMADHTSITPRPGWSEQKPEEWWEATCAATKAVLRKAKLRAGDVGGIGLSGQMHGSVFLGDGPKPLRNALLWNDQRTQEQCDEITRKAGGREALIELVANPALTGFT